MANPCRANSELCIAYLLVAIGFELDKLIKFKDFAIATPFSKAVQNTANILQARKVFHT